MNLTVPILGERWSPMLVSANPPAVISSGDVALRQTEIGQLQTYGYVWRTTALLVLHCDTVQPEAGLQPGRLLMHRGAKGGRRRSRGVYLSVRWVPTRRIE